MHEVSTITCYTEAMVFIISVAIVSPNHQVMFVMRGCVLLFIIHRKFETKLLI